MPQPLADRPVLHHLLFAFFVVHGMRNIFVRDDDSSSARRTHPRATRDGRLVVGGFEMMFGAWLAVYFHDIACLILHGKKTQITHIVAHSLRQSSFPERSSWQHSFNATYLDTRPM